MLNAGCLSSIFQSGGVYVYSNCHGCDGGRLYFDGCCLVAVNGTLVAQGKTFTLQDVEVTTATVDLDEVTTHRGRSHSAQYQGTRRETYPRVLLDGFLCSDNPALQVSQPVRMRLEKPEEEISLGPACWMWDYLRRSGMNGYFLPLSGGEFFNLLGKGS